MVASVGQVTKVSAGPARPRGSLALGFSGTSASRWRPKQALSILTDGPVPAAAAALGSRAGLLNTAGNRLEVEFRRAIFSLSRLLIFPTFGWPRKVRPCDRKLIERFCRRRAPLALSEGCAFQ